METVAPAEMTPFERWQRIPSCPLHTVKAWSVHPYPPCQRLGRDPQEPTTETWGFLCLLLGMDMAAVLAAGSRLPVQGGVSHERQKSEL